MEKNIEILNEILNQIDDISKENLDKAIQMVNEEYEGENIPEILIIKYEDYVVKNNTYKQDCQYEYFNLHRKNTSNTCIEEVA